MISVAATTVGIPFDINMPDLADRYPVSLDWTVTVLIMVHVGLYLKLAGKLSKELSTL